MEYKKTSDDELNKITKLIHNEHQQCAELNPSTQIQNFTSWDDVGVMIPCHPYWGVAGQGDYNITEYQKFIKSDFEIADFKYVINDVSRVKIEGAASTKSQKFLYTCQMGQCVIHCPCNLCNRRRSQCSSHKLNMTRLFNSVDDQYTLVTSWLLSYR